MNPEENTSAVDFLFSKFQAVDSLWKDIRRHDWRYDEDASERAGSASFTTPTGPSSQRRPSWRDRDYLLQDCDVKETLLTPLLSDTPATVESSSVDGDDSMMSSTSPPAMAALSDPHDEEDRHNNSSESGEADSNCEGGTGDALHRLRDSSSVGDDRDRRQGRSAGNRDHRNDGGAHGAAPPWYSDPMQVSAMISNFSTSYNVANVSLVLPILGLLWESSTNERNKSAVASSLLAGMMVGQVGGGVLGDAPSVGRLKALALVMALQVGASVASALCQSYVSLVACRFVLGIGAGGVYPLAAALSAEQQGRQSAGGSAATSLRRVVLTFSMQGVGFLAVPVVAVLLLAVTTNLQVVWRLILALGCVPGVLLMGLLCWTHQRRHRRALVPTVEHDELANEADAPPGAHESMNGTEEPEQQPPSHHGVWDAIRHEENLVRKLVGTAGTWFLFDVLFYGNTLFQPIVIQAAFGSVDSDANETDPIRDLRQTALHSLFLTLIAVPGYAVAGMVLGSKTFGCSQTPRYVMLQGFLAMSLLYLTIGLGWKDLRRFPSVLLTLYAFTFFFANYGPNTTTFCLPSLVYSPECRTTLNGLSAAAGKLGAWTGATLFSPAAAVLGDATVLILCSLISIVAFFMTVFFVPRSHVVDVPQPIRGHRGDSDERSDEGSTRSNRSGAADDDGVLV